ncbi:MAG: hypothetical protein QM757_06325 [Paludibaculum sp.]
MNTAFFFTSRGILATAAISAFLTIQAPKVFAAERNELSTSKEVMAPSAKGLSPAEHSRLAQYYLAKAERHEAEAVQHEVLAVEYTRHPQVSAAKHPMAPNSAEHCRYYAQHCHKAAAEMRSLAQQHEAQARTAAH